MARRRVHERRCAGSGAGVLLSVLEYLKRNGRGSRRGIGRVVRQAEPVDVDPQDGQNRDMRGNERRHPKHDRERREQSKDSEVAQRMEAFHAASGLALVAATLPIRRSSVSIGARRVRKAVTTSGSNWSPASARMAAMAAS